jgi:hypothetical protein
MPDASPAMAASLVAARCTQRPMSEFDDLIDARLARLDYIGQNVGVVQYAGIHRRETFASPKSRD